MQIVVSIALADMVTGALDPALFVIAHRALSVAVQRGGVREALITFVGRGALITEVERIRTSLALAFVI